MPTGPLVRLSLILGTTENDPVPRRLLVASTAVTTTLVIGPFGTVTFAVAMPDDDALTVASGAEPTLPQWIATFSPLANPLQVTVAVEPTIPEVGESEHDAVTPPGDAVPARISGSVPKP